MEIESTTVAVVYNKPLSYDELLGEYQFKLI